MEVEIKSCLWGAKQAKGITVIIDVFRASNTILTMLKSGIKEITIVGEMRKARKLKEQKPKYFLCGERNRIKPDDFDYGNSPSEFKQARVKGRKAILTTSAGSRAIINATNAREIIIGSFSNAYALVNYIRKKNPRRVSIIAVGKSARKKAIEDELCAQYIVELLKGKKKSISGIRKQIINSSAAKELRKLKHQKDIPLCLKFNDVKIVPKVKRARNYFRITK